MRIYFLIFTFISMINLELFSQDFSQTDTLKNYSSLFINDYNIKYLDYYSKNKLLWVNEYFGDISFYNLTKKEVEKTIKGNILVFSGVKIPDGSGFIICGDNEIIQYNYFGEVINRYKKKNSGFISICIDKTSKNIAFYDFNNEFIYIYNIQTHKLKRKIKVENDIWAMSFINDEQLMVGFNDGLIEVLDALSGKIIKTINKKHTYSVVKILIAEKQNKIITTDGFSIALWDNKINFLGYIDSGAYISDILLTPDNKKLIITDYDGSIFIKELLTSNNSINIKKNIEVKDNEIVQSKISIIDLEDFKNIKVLLSNKCYSAMATQDSLNFFVIVDNQGSGDLIKFDNFHLFHTFKIEITDSIIYVAINPQGDWLSTYSFYRSYLEERNTFNNKGVNSRFPIELVNNVQFALNGTISIYTGLHSYFDFLEYYTHLSKLSKKIIKTYQNKYKEKYIGIFVNLHELDSIKISCLSKDTRYLGIITMNNEISVFDFMTLNIISRKYYKFESEPKDIEFVDNGNSLLIALKNGTILNYNLSNKLISKIFKYEDEIKSIISTKSTNKIIALNKNILSIFDSNYNCIYKLKNDSNFINMDVVLYKDRYLVLLQHISSNISVTSYTKIYPTNTKNYFYKIALSPDKKNIVLCRTDGSFKILELK